MPAPKYEDHELTPEERKEERIRDIARLIEPIEPDLRKLSKEHVEEIVIWLKSFHNPPDPWEKDNDAYSKTMDWIKAQRESPEQTKLIWEANKNIYGAIVWALICGMLTSGIVIGTALTTKSVIYPVIVFIVWSLAVFWFVYKTAIQGVLIFKEQDQRFVLGCIRKANCVTELNRAGLFAYSNDAADCSSKKYKENEAEAALQIQINHMRDAIYRNAYEGRLAAAFEYLELWKD